MTPLPRRSDALPTQNKERASPHADQPSVAEIFGSRNNVVLPFQVPLMTEERYRSSGLGAEGLRLSRRLAGASLRPACRRRCAVTREELADLTDWRRRPQRCQGGRHQQIRMTGRECAAGPDSLKAAQQDTWPKSGWAQGGLFHSGMQGARCKRAVERRGTGPRPQSRSDAGRAQAGQSGGIADS